MRLIRLNLLSANVLTRYLVVKMPQKTDKRTVGEIIAEARKNSGLSLRAIAGQIPITFSYLAEIEKGTRTPSEKILKGLSLLPELNLDFDHLMAHSGKIGGDAELYLKEHPAFGKVIRNISQKKLNDEALESLNETVNKLKS